MRNPLITGVTRSGHVKSVKLVFNQAKTGKIILAGMGNALPYPIIFDRLVLDACQVTNPSIDPLREPMELRTYLGKKPSSLSLKESADGTVELITKLSPNLQIETPIMVGHMSYGAISLNAQTAIAKAVSRIGTFMGTGEGGLHESLYPYQKNMIVQVASGRFGVDINYLERGAAIEIKIGQGAKPGLGGHLPGEKICADVSYTRMIPEGSDAISPAPHHDIYSIEDLKQLVRSLKEATEWKKPVFVKIAAVHNSAAIAAGIARSSADAVVIDGFRGGTGAAPGCSGITLVFRLKRQWQVLMPNCGSRGSGTRSQSSQVAGSVKVRMWQRSSALALTRCISVPPLSLPWVAVSAAPATAGSAHGALPRRNRNSQRDWILM